MTAVEHLHDALVAHGSTVKGKPSNFMAQCPAHDDRNPSLSVVGANGKVLVKCHAGCRQDDVLAALDLTMADLFDEPKRHNGASYHVVAEYEYTDQHGELLFVVERRIPKDFLQRRPDGRGGWIWKLGNVKPVLYRLPEVIAAVAASKPVFVVEGEKDVHALESVGIVATCNPMGAGKWSKVDPSPLYGGQVLIVADQDDAGRKHAADVLASLQGRANAAIFAPTAGKDAADHIAAGYGVGDFVQVSNDKPSAAATDVDGVLDDVEQFLARFVAYPSEHARIAHTLWIAHTHLMAAWDSTPRIAFLSPEPGSGKTRAIEVTELLVPNPVEAVNVTPAYIFRKVGECAPTILYDEIDTVFGPKAKDNEEIRGLLNAGHRRGAVAGRCVVRGKLVETEEIPAYTAVALAGLGGLPDTLLSRSVVIRMRRRAPGERVEQFRRRQHIGEGHELRDRLAMWAESVSDTVTGAWPTMPQGVEDRDADVWEALLAVADAASEQWSRRARVAAVALVAQAKASTPSLGVLLLAHLRDVFGDADAMHTETILDRLYRLSEAPWRDLHGKPLDARGLASRLGEYGVRSAKVWADGRSLQGYRRADLWDAFTRYLSPAREAEGPEGTEGTLAETAGQPSAPSAPSGSAGGEPITPSGFGDAVQALRDAGLVD
jgi:5S rRNA maturation endonuclease (ribonuclease M5)